MAVKEYPLDKIDDNPYNPRKHYGQVPVREMAHSLQEIGLRQMPEGRVHGERIQLAYGHMRLRGFRYNLNHKVKGAWVSMPVDVTDISDHDMFHFAMEENLCRTDITPLEVARCIEGFCQAFPDVLDEAIAKKHNMTAAHVSNMKRVLRLPDKFLEKIDEGKITFTQGRELLIMEGIPNAENLMKAAVGRITGTGYYTEPNTVDGLRKSIFNTIKDHFPPLEKEWESYNTALLFDTRAAGCLKCDKCISTHPTKSQVAHFCTDQECWDSKQEEHRQKAAAAAKAELEADIIKRAAEKVNISQEKPAAEPSYKMEKRGTSWIALDDQGRVVAEHSQKKIAEERAKASFDSVATKVNPGTSEYLLNHTYRVIPKPGHRRKDYVSDVTAQDLATAIIALGLSPGNVESVKVWKSSGKLGTGGYVSSGWSKCTESMEAPDQTAAFYQERNLEAHADNGDRQLEEIREKANLERPVGEIPCDTCLKKLACGREHFHVSEEGEQFICDVWELLPTAAPTAVPTAQTAIPDEILKQARAAAGTRAEVLDLNDISTDFGYQRQMKSGYNILDDVLSLLDNPDECLEECTAGFHFAFDSKAKTPRHFKVCANGTCLGKKKGALTRKKNAAGQALKIAERKAIKEAIAGADLRRRGLIMLVFYAQIKGRHISGYSYGGEKLPEKWLWDKVSAGTADKDRSTGALLKKIEKLDGVESQRLLTEMMFFYLVDNGDTGSYEIKTELPLKLMGVEIELEQEKEPVAAGATTK